MPVFAVSMDDVGFGCEKGAFEELDPDAALAFTEVAKAEGWLPEGILGVKGAVLSVDDSVYEGGADENEDVKAFVNVTLIVEADDEDAARAIAGNSNELLARVATRLCAGIAMEGTWEDLDTEPYEAPAFSPAP